MPLQGTFDVLGFPDVGELLASKKATGRLHVRSRSLSANLYVEEGRLVGADIGEHANGSTVDVRSRLEEVCFELLEADRGSFEFIPDMTGMGPPTLSLEIDDVLDTARRLLEQWREIQTVIPSLDGHPSVVADLANDEVTLTRERWRLVTAIDGRRSIRAIARFLGNTDFEVCRIIKSLIEDGVVELDAPARSIPGGRETLVFTDDSVEALVDGAQVGAGSAPSDTHAVGESASEDGLDPSTATGVVPSGGAEVAEEEDVAAGEPAEAHEEPPAPTPLAAAPDEAADGNRPAQPKPGPARSVPAPTPALRAAGLPRAQRQSIMRLGRKGRGTRRDQ